MTLEIQTHATQKGGFINVTVCSDPLVAFHLNSYEAREWSKMLLAAAKEAEAKFKAHPKMRLAARGAQR